MGKQRIALGIRLLNLSVWIRRQPWLRAVYRHFPAAFRNRMSEALAAHVEEQIKFPRTANWQRSAPSPEPIVPAHSDRYAGAPGVNIFAYARGQFGLAESARLYARALMAEGYPVAIHDIDLEVPHSMDDSSLDPHIGDETPYAVNMIFVNPDHLDQALASIGSDSLGSRPTVACWFWELEQFPEEWLPALNLVDEVMVSTRFIETSLSRISDKPVWRAPLPISETPDNGLMRADFGLDEDAYVFLNSFDFNSSQARKNPYAVVMAFRRAFADDQRNVQLLIKTSNGHRHPEKLHELLNAAAFDSRIVVRDEVIDRSDLQALQRCADAYVSLHRAEGFGLGLAECMRLGKPVIATGWSGNMEFMTPENSCLVDYRLVPVGEGEYPHWSGQRWAEADVSQAATYMRRLIEDPTFATRIGTQAAVDIRLKLSPQVTAERIIQQLATLSRLAPLSRSGDSQSTRVI